MAEKRTKEDKLLRNIKRLEKETQRALLDKDRREPGPEEVKEIAASAASDST